MDVNSVREIAEYVYADFENPEEYTNDFYVFPCVKFETVKKEAPMVTITFELTVTIKETGDKVFFETSVDVPKENLEDALSALRAMPHVRNIQY
jgi:hypothetical protein